MQRNRKMELKNTSFATTVAFLTGIGAWFSALPVYAVEIENPLGDTTLIGFFRQILDAVIVLAIPIIVFFIIYAGFLYVTARGNAEQVSKAHKALLYAIIGGVLILGANVLIDVIGGTVDSFRT